MNNYPLHDFSKDDASSIPFKFVKLGIKEKYDIHQPHRHNYYEVFMFNKGGGNHLIDFEDFPVKSYSLHFVSPGQVHQLRRSLDSLGVYMEFSREFYYLNRENKDLLYELPFLNNNTSRPILELDETQYDFFKGLADSMEQEYAGNNPFKEEMIRSYLNILLIHCRRLFVETQPLEKRSAANEINTRFRVLLESHFTQWHKPSDYADHLAISEKHLNEVVKAASGKTVGDVIQERLMLEASRLLIHSGLSTKEIAFFLNFEDPSYFTKVFKRNTGMTPGAFVEEAGKRFR